MRPFSKSLPFALLSLAGLSEAAAATHQWTLASKDIAPDGFTRSAALVNGQYPGPLLSFNKGDTAYVNVNNRLSDPTMRRSTSIVRFCGIFVAYTHILFSIGTVLYAAQSIHIIQ